MHTKDNRTLTRKSSLMAKRAVYRGQSSTSSVTEKASKTHFPDIGYIRQRIPITGIAERLGVKLTGRTMAHCWRPEKHANGDADPSVRFHLKLNKGRCFVCDAHSWSNVDLVMMMLNYEVREAVHWIAGHYFVPSIPRGKHTKQSQKWHPQFRAGVGSRLEAIVKSGVWAAELTQAQRSILVVLNEFADPNTCECEISYAGIMRYSGVGSPSTVAAAIRRLKQLHLLDVQRGWAGDGFRLCNRYQLTFDNEEFQANLSRVHRANQDSIELEREFRKERKKLRKAQREKAAATYTHKHRLPVDEKRSQRGKGAATCTGK